MIKPIGGAAMGSGQPPSNEAIATHGAGTKGSLTGRAMAHLNAGLKPMAKTFAIGQRPETIKRCRTRPQIDRALADRTKITQL